MRPRAPRSGGGFEHNAWRPVGANAPARYRGGNFLLATEEDFGPPEEGCRNQGHFIIASLAGSRNGEAWRSTPEKSAGAVVHWGGSAGTAGAPARM